MDAPRHVLKEGFWSIAYGASGWVEGHPESAEGVYLEDVRLLDLYEVRLAGRALPAAWVGEGSQGRTRLSCPNPAEGSGWPAGTAVLEVERRVSRSGLVEVLRLTNHGRNALQGPLEVLLNFDFADTSEVSGELEARWQRAVEVERPRDDALFAHYRGPDGFQASALLASTRPFDWSDDGLVSFPLTLNAGDAFEVELRLGGLVGEGTLVAPTAAAADVELERASAAWRSSLPQVETGVPELDALLERCAEDLRQLWTWTARDSGFFAPSAPLAVAPLGPEALGASRAFLWMLPEQARWTLAELARHPGQRLHPASGEQPGKLPWVVRRGERTRHGAHPRGYATIETSLGFPALLAEYLAWSGDLEFVREMEPVLRGVLDWCATYGDADGDGFLDPGDGQGARVEHQGLAREALLGCQVMFQRLGDAETAVNCRTVADELRRKFDLAFGRDDGGGVAATLDRHGRARPEVTSAPGRCLVGDLVEPDRRPGLVDRLLQPDLFSGFGLRSRAKGSVGYSPYREGQGAVDPFETAQVVFGMHRRGFRAEGNGLGAALLESLAGLPDQRPGARWAGLAAGETGDVVAELAQAPKPHAPAASAAFLVLRAVLGLVPDALGRRVVLRPDLGGLPFDELRVRQLRLAGGSLSFDVRRDGEVTRVVPVAKQGDFAVDLGDDGGAG